MCILETFLSSTLISLFSCRFGTSYFTFGLPAGFCREPKCTMGILPYRFWDPYNACCCFFIMKDLVPIAGALLKAQQERKWRKQVSTHFLYHFTSFFHLEPGYPP